LFRHFFKNVKILKIKKNQKKVLTNTPACGIIVSERGNKKKKKERGTKNV
jgi:hypothetical protein